MTSTDKIPWSEEERYSQLDKILLGSCEFLRNVFVRRWKLETGEVWVNDEDHVQRFMQEVGKPSFRKLQVYQKRAIEGSKSVEEWDLSLLCAVLGNFGERKASQRENAGVKTVQQIRNFLAHHCNKRISEVEYRERVAVVRSSLLSLGAKEMDIDNLVEGAGSRSSTEALKHLKDLFRKASVFLKNGKVDQAEKCYSEGLVLPSLLPEKRGEAYEKRAEFFLGQIKDAVADSNKCNNALLDAKKALELNSSSWVAHHLIAQCYRHRNELSRAVEHFHRALAISPGQTQVKADLDGCRVLEEGQKRRDYQNPRLMPMSLSERIAHLEGETGIKMTKKQFLHHKQFGEGIVIPGQDHVFRGHQCVMGWDVPVNYEEAVRHYKNAAKVKNAEGMYNLGQCYELGRGVKQNAGEALRIYREVAELNHQPLGNSTLKCAVGVAAAQHAIGLMYDNGIAVEQNFAEAAGWYQRAMDNGAGPAANNLGMLYFQGRGVAQNKKMAELCWKQGVALKDANAPGALVDYYMEEMEPDKAKGMWRIGKEIGNHYLLHLSESEFNERLVDLAKSRSELEPQLLEFERAHQLSRKGFTFGERLNRQFYGLTPTGLKLQTLFESGNPDDLTKDENFGGNARMEQLSSTENIMEIQARAEKGSVAAANVLHIMESSIALNFLLEDVRESAVTEEEAADIVDLFYSCSILREGSMVRMSGHNAKKLKTLLAKQFEKKCGIKGEDDMKIRFCYVSSNLSRSAYSSDMYGVELMKEGIQRYPDNVYYYKHLANLLGCKKCWEWGKFWAEKGLALFPEDADLLYSLAVHLRRGAGDNEGETIATYKRFLAVAPKDHRKVPEAFYQIASFYCHRAFESSQDLEMMETFYKRGLEAERQQLPCYLPYGCSDVKSLVETTILTLRREVGSSFMQTPVTNAKVPAGSGDVLEGKPHLRSPTRKNVITAHREMLKGNVEAEIQRRKAGKRPPALTTQPPKLKQTRVKRVSALEPITLVEMNPTQDHIFENKFLDLTIMDEPNSSFASIHLIAEDENGDVIRVYIYNVDKTPESLRYFQPGCRLAIMSPYMRIGAMSITPGIRNDEPNNLVYLQKVESMCRFCGEGNATQKCAKCKRPYCSRECQKLDWKMMDHKLICGL